MLSGRLKKKLKIDVIIAAATILSLWYGGEVTGPLRRKLSVNLGGGDCQWRPPLQYTDTDFPRYQKLTKTIIAGFPSGDKRLTFLQLEGLTGLAARDEWNFQQLGTTNEPFIKANYPHHEGVWGWGRNGDQVIMVVSDIRKVMIEYHDILWDIGYARTKKQAYERMENLYTETKLYTEFEDGQEGVDENAPVADFLIWRDMRVLDEIHWYSWFIDYYMEAGLMRDMFNHQLTAPSQWKKAMKPDYYTKHEARHGRFVHKDEYITPSYDDMCSTLTKGCYPVLVVDPEKLIDRTEGPAESRKLAELVNGGEGIKDWLIGEKAWGCIWSKLVVEKVGSKTFQDKNIDHGKYTYSFELRNEMWHELNRLITKYEVQDDRTAMDLVRILKGHRDALGVETPVDPISYEELMSYHLAFPPYFPKQKQFVSDDDFFVRTHQTYLDPEKANVESIIDHRRAWYKEEMAKTSEERKVTVKYYYANGWTALPSIRLDHLTQYAEDTTHTIGYRKTLNTGTFAGSGRADNVAALFQGYLVTDQQTVTHICLTSVDGSKLFLDDALLINLDGRHSSSKLCAAIPSGLHKVDLEYFNTRGNAVLVLEFRGHAGDRVVPARSWASAEGRRRYRDVMKRNDMLEKDLRNLKETDIMGPWTRTEFNKRKETATNPSFSQQQKSKIYNFAMFDGILSERIREKIMSGV